MPPTIQSNGRHQSRSRIAGAEKRSDLVCRLKFHNTLPDIPFDPKYISYPFDPMRYVQYNSTSLERSYKFDLLTENDLGVAIDLINPDTYRTEYDAELDPADEFLLEDESNVQTDAKRSRHHNKNVSWLRKTEYISTEYNRFTQSALKSEARLGYSIKKTMTDEVLYKDRESQIKAIKDTFDHATNPIIQHYSKPGVTAVEVLPMFPDFDMWKHPCAQVIFDSDPAQKGKSLTQQNEEMSQAMIRGMVDEHGEQFVAYFLPTSETMEKHKRDVEVGVEYDENEEYDYVLASEYNWNVKNKASRGYEENYFFVLKDDGVFYNELETRVRLSKRRKVGPSATSSVKSRLIMKHRPLNDQEISQQNGRIMQLEPPGEEEEDLDRDVNPKTTEADDKQDASGSPARKRARGSESPMSDRSFTSSTKRRLGQKESVAGSPAGSGKASPRSSARSSPARSAAASPAGSAPGSPAGSAPGSPAGSAPGSPAGSASGNPAGSVPHSPAGSAPGSPAGSNPTSRAGSNPGSQAGSNPGSPAGSNPGSPAGSPRGSVAGSALGSPATSAPGSPAGSNRSSPARSTHSSRVGSAPGSPAGSAPGSPAAIVEADSRPGSPVGSVASSPAGSAGEMADSLHGSPAASGSDVDQENDTGIAERMRIDEAAIFGSDPEDE